MEVKLQKQVLRGIWVAICIAMIGAAIYFLTPLLYPFIIAWLIAYVMKPLVELLDTRLRLPRWMAVTISLIIYVGGTVGILILLVSNLVIEIGYLTTLIQISINSWIESGIRYIQSDFVQSIIGRLVRFYSDNPQYQETINNHLSNSARQLANLGTDFVAYLLGLIVALVKSLPNRATVLIIILLATFFISKDWYRLKSKIANWFSVNIQKTGTVIWNDLQKALFGYVRAQLVLVSITAIVIMLGLTIIGVEHPVSIGLLIGLCDLMPYLGVGAVMVPWFAYVFIQGDVTLGIGLSILYGIVLVVRQLIEPKVLATSVGLEPLPLLISMFVGLNLFGVIGLIIGPVSVIILFTFHRAGVFQNLKNYIVKGPV
jgi:sporulation integral membrane protein YtvI